MRPAEVGDIFATDEKEIVRVRRVSPTGRVVVQVIGGPKDGLRMTVRGVPDSWSQYPSK